MFVKKPGTLPHTQIAAAIGIAVSLYCMVFIPQYWPISIFCIVAGIINLARPPKRVWGLQAVLMWGLVVVLALFLFVVRPAISPTAAERRAAERAATIK